MCRPCGDGVMCFKVSQNWRKIGKISQLSQKPQTLNSSAKRGNYHIKARPSIWWFRCQILPKKKKRKKTSRLHSNFWAFRFGWIRGTLVYDNSLSSSAASQTWKLERWRESWNNFHISGALMLFFLLCSWSISFHSICVRSRLFEYGFHSVLWIKCCEENKSWGCAEFCVLFFSLVCPSLQ